MSTRKSYENEREGEREVRIRIWSLGVWKKSVDGFSYMRTEVEEGESWVYNERIGMTGWTGHTLQS